MPGRVAPYSLLVQAISQDNSPCESRNSTPSTAKVALWQVGPVTLHYDKRILILPSGSQTANTVGARAVPARSSRNRERTVRFVSRLLSIRPRCEPGTARAPVVVSTLHYDAASNRPYFRISGQISAMAMTTMMVPMPPDTTEKHGLVR
jgi:hypothetical protein